MRSEHSKHCFSGNRNYFRKPDFGWGIVFDRYRDP